MSALGEVLVIGGGIIGVCAAYYLARQGWSVTLLERGELAGGCSYGNAGLVVPSHVTPLPRPGVLSSGLKWLLDPASPLFIRFRPDPALLAWLARFVAASTAARVEKARPVLHALNQASRALFADLVAGEALECEFAAKGLLEIYASPGALRRGARAAANHAAQGLAVEVLNAEQVRAREPLARPGVAGGLYFREDAHLDPAAFVLALAGRLPALGVTLCPQTEVLGWQRAGKRIVQVDTTRGAYRPGQVVLAAGAWTPGLAGLLGLNLPIQPAKGYSLTYRRPEPCPSLPLLLAESRVAVTPTESWLRLAGTLEFSGLDLSINMRRVAAVAVAPGRYLDLPPAGLELLEIWRGLRPVTPDGLPIIGRAPGIENLILAGGHGMLGVSIGPVTGQLVAQLAAGETPSIDLAPLRPDRF